MYLVKNPFWLPWLYPQLTWKKNRKEKQIYLTFDDGPIPVVTPFVIDTLKRFDARATFFCIGDNILKHSDIFRSLKASGNAIGHHTFNHLRGWTTANEMYLENVLKCQKLVSSNLFRPPYGRIKRSQIKEVRAALPDIKIIMWDVLSGDFDLELTPNKCLQNVIRHTENGSIVVFHDSLKAWPRLEYALPKALEFWSNKGYSFQTL